MALIKRNENSGFPSIFSDFFENDDFLGFGSGLARRQQNIPAVNIKETDKAYDIEMAAPGIPKDSINIEVENDMLTISGENKQEKEDSDKDGRYTRREFSYSSFSRSFKLPPNVNADDVKARCDNGVVNITIPKKEEQRNKRRIKL
jgi:HSP20 family protein